MRKITLIKKKNENHQNISKRTSVNQWRDISAVKLRRKLRASQPKIWRVSTSDSSPKTKVDHDLMPRNGDVICLILDSHHCRSPSLNCEHSHIPLHCIIVKEYSEIFLFHSSLSSLEIPSAPSLHLTQVTVFYISSLCD